jgi:hypothetical protein
MAGPDATFGEAGLADRDGGARAGPDGGVAVGAPVELGELVVGAGEADLEALDLAEPAFAFGLGDAGQQVVADLLQSGSLRRVWSQERTSDTSMLMNAGTSKSAGAGPDGHLPLLEMSKESVPLFFGGGSVFFAWP